MKPLVGIIMGSKSDWETMRAAAETLEKLAVPHEVRVVSAHRTPDLLFEYASTARERGLEVIIAGAGGAAHLPGMTAAKTSLPVLGVPVQSKALNGLDSLLSIVQMPAGVPVATFAIGVAGATNAALIAAAILANKHAADRRRARGVPQAADRGRARRTPIPRTPPRMTVGIVGAGQLGRMLALAGYPLGLDFLFLDPAPGAPAGQVAPQICGEFTDAKLAGTLARDTRGAHLRLGEHLGRCAAQAAEEHAHLPADPRARRRAGSRERKAAVRAPEDSHHALARRGIARAARTQPWQKIGLPGVLKTRRLGYDGKGQRVLRKPADVAGRVGRARQRAAALRRDGAVRLRGIDHRRAQHARRGGHLSAQRQRARAKASCGSRARPIGSPALQRRAARYLRARAATTSATPAC